VSESSRGRWRRLGGGGRHKAADYCGRWRRGPQLSKDFKVSGGGGGGNSGDLLQGIEVVRGRGLVRQWAAVGGSTGHHRH
jgi:hypothetical protein